MAVEPSAQIEEASLTLGVIFPELITPVPNSTENVTNKKRSLKEETSSSHVEKSKISYLTFDDGPSDVTPMVLDVLHKYKIPASFFVIGSQVEAYPEIVQRIAQEGHLVGNHTYSHKYRLIYASSQAFFQDLYKAEDVLSHVIGQRPKIIRAPGGTRGNFTDSLATKLKEKGYVFHDWNVDSRDSSAPLVSAEVIRNQVLQQSSGKERVVILLHDGPGKTTLPQALPGIIEGLLQQGFVFKPIDETIEPIVAMYQ